MRKITLILLILLMGFTLIAAESYYKGNTVPDDNKRPQLSVNFNLASQKDYYFGFTRTAPTSTDSFDAFEVTPADGTVELGLAKDRNIGTLKDGETLYVFWKIRSNSPATITLSTGGAMHDTGNINSLGWTTSWTNKSGGGLEGNTSGSNTNIVSKGNNKFTEYGFVELKIETDDITNIVPTSYSGNLILTFKEN